MPIRLSKEHIHALLSQPSAISEAHEKVIQTDVFIAGSGPIASTYARQIIDNHKTATVCMAEIGAQDSPVVGSHHKNTIKPVSRFLTFFPVNVIKGALQPVSVPPSDTYISTLGGNGWTPSLTDVLITEGRNPDQDPRVNLGATAVTRTVGGMATHWTCSCPMPHEEERVNNPIPRNELDSLLEKAKGLLNVHSDQYNDSIRNQVVRAELQKRFPRRGITDLPLGVERRKDNKCYVTWTGADTVLKDTVKDPRFRLLTETRVTKLMLNDLPGDEAICALVRDLRNDRDVIVVAKVCHSLNMLHMIPDLPTGYV
uniref:LysM domain-containing protein n=1 Tax=Ganoderma boninense TaxID=34458 RepID=A0A5K1K0Z9_9APHY|nr:LysM domain-containing protein [Ganoderma boninense]